MAVWVAGLLLVLCIAGAVFFGIRKKKGLMIAGIIASLLMFAYMILIWLLLSAID